MKPYYLCPHCYSVLNVNDDIVLTFKKQNETNGLLFFHSEIGNYDVSYNECFKFEKNEYVEFCCPICSKSLSTDKHKNLALLKMKDGDVEHTIVFSKIFGEKCTYKISDSNVEIFGEHSENYIDFDNLSFMK